MLLLPGKVKFVGSRLEGVVDFFLYPDDLLPTAAVVFFLGIHARSHKLSLLVSF